MTGNERTADRDAIIRAIAKAPGTTVADIGGRTGLRHQVIWGHLGDLERTRVVRRHDGDRYSLVGGYDRRQERPRRHRQRTERPAPSPRPREQTTARIDASQPWRSRTPPPDAWVDARIAFLERTVGRDG